MAATRTKRSTAGNKLSNLLEAEDEDDFYKTTYGGFNEEEGDIDYRSEESSGDEVDTDFSIDENDEVISDHEDEPKRKKTVSTKAYKEPTKPKEKKEVGERKPKEKANLGHVTRSVDKKVLRRSTQVKAELTEQRQRERKEEAQKGGRKKKLIQFNQLTQEELLAEAMLTEGMNLKSLETYQKMELERKKTRIVKHTYKGPIIRYHSMSMPLIEELPDDYEKINIEELGESESPQKSEKPDVVTKERCSRNFVTFTDEATFNEYFVKTKPKVPLRNFCPITRLPARYYDPVTQMAYANLQAFKVLREAYYQQLEQKGDRKQPDVATWIEWRKQWRAQQQQNQPHAQHLQQQHALQQVLAQQKQAALQAAQQKTAAVS